CVALLLGDFVLRVDGVFAGVGHGRLRFQTRLGLRGRLDVIGLRLFQAYIPVVSLAGLARLLRRLVVCVGIFDGNLVFVFATRSDRIGGVGRTDREYTQRADPNRLRYR